MFGLETNRNPLTHTHTHTIYTDLHPDPRLSWDIRNWGVWRKEAWASGMEAETVLSRRMGAHRAQLIHQPSLVSPSPAGLQTNSRPYLVKKELWEEMKLWEEMNLIPSTGPGDRSGSTVGNSGEQREWAIVTRQVAVYGGLGSTTCQVLCQGFTLDSYHKYEVDPLFNVHLRKTKPRPRAVK